MNIIEHLLSRAEGYWGNHSPLPLDLFYEMLGEGIDVGEAEKQFHNRQEQ